MHLTLKISTQEQARLLGAALQDQWKKVGVALEVRPLETATLFSDLSEGQFSVELFDLDGREQRSGYL